MNTFIVIRNLSGDVVVSVFDNKTIDSIRSLTDDEMSKLNGLLNETEFEQQINQEKF